MGMALGTDEECFSETAKGQTHSCWRRFGRESFCGELRLCSIGISIWLRSALRLVAFSAHPNGFVSSIPMNIRLLLVLALSVAAPVAGLRAQTDAKPKPATEESTPLEDTMDKMNGAFKVLKRQVADASKN